MPRKSDIVTVLKIIVKVILAARIDKRVDKEETHGKLAEGLLEIANSGVRYAWPRGIQ